MTKEYEDVPEKQNHFDMHFATSKEISKEVKYTTWHCKHFKEDFKNFLMEYKKLPDSLTLKK